MRLLYGLAFSIASHLYTIYIYRCTCASPQSNVKSKKLAMNTIYSCRIWKHKPVPLLYIYYICTIHIYYTKLLYTLCYIVLLYIPYHIGILYTTPLETRLKGFLKMAEPELITVSGLYKNVKQQLKTTLAL